MNESDLELLKVLFARFFNQYPESDRIAKMNEWFYGSPICDRLNYNGSNSVFVPRLITQLRDFGDIIPDKPALAHALEGIRKEMGSDVQRECDRLIERLRNNRTIFLRLIHRPAQTEHHDAIRNCKLALIAVGIEVREVRVE